MTSISRMRGGHIRFLEKDDWGTAGESFKAFLRSLTVVLSNSTVGVALYDKNLRCQAVNGALAAMTGVPVTEQIGKTFPQVFGEGARGFETAFQGVCAAGSSLSNFEFEARLPAEKKFSRWLVNFYPIKDESGIIRLVAILFFEITKKSSAERRLCQLLGRLIANDSRDPSIGEEGFAELSTRSLELVKQSLELIKCSMTLRLDVSESRIEAGLIRLASFLTLARGQQSTPPAAPLQGRNERGLGREHGSPEKRDRPTGGPSARERQVVGLLAEGKSNKEMAAILEISTRTVEAYRARVMAKLKLHSVAELVRYAVRNNLTQA
ncbi:MAG TPA: LuxR C-terminal-related transcriptional regulator [Candidatus Acidoferrum sp.]|nr:LuxR C-terminal-related transcriptional regulator [Candidatus Acidoferrum sp.]